MRLFESIYGINSDRIKKLYMHKIYNYGKIKWGC